MNHLQSVIDSLPQYHLRGKPLADMTLANIGEIVHYFRHVKLNPFRAWQFDRYAYSMELNFGKEWKERSNGFTLGASCYIKRRRADYMLQSYGISIQG